MTSRQDATQLPAPTIDRIWPESTEHWCDVFDARQAIADPALKSDEEEKREAQRDAFLFHLDWNTEPNLMAAAAHRGRTPAIDAEQWASLADALERGLRQRWYGTAGSATIGAVRTIAERVSAIVSEAIALLPGDSDHDRMAEAAAVLHQFGCGTRQRVVSFGTREDGGRLFINEPDSYFIWYFAEFAVQAIELGIDEARWSALLPDLIAAAHYYSARFKVRRALRAHAGAGAPLTDAKKKGDADSAAAALRKLHGAVPGELLRASMRSVATSFA